jgi:general secretion pathway protein I
MPMHAKATRITSSFQRTLESSLIFPLRNDEIGKDPSVRRGDGHLDRRCAKSHERDNRVTERRRTWARAPGRGFTLLEVLIAILLLSLALTALVRLSGLEARASAHLRDATFAQWVAANALAEARLRGAPAAGSREEGEALLGDRRWHWRLTAQATDEPSILRLDVQVYARSTAQERAQADDDFPTAVLTGFTGGR